MKDLDRIAVVGLALRLPGVRTPEEFWRDLLRGHEAVRDFTADELRAAGVPERVSGHPDYVARGAALEDVDQFDAHFFGFTPREANITDPQHRLFLETAWLALEDAGVDPARSGGPIGVFASASMSTYLLNQLLHSDEVADGEITHPLLIGNDKDFLATRVAHKFDLSGPALTVQSACSSSMVAIHLAMGALSTGDCTVAVAGGVSVTVPQTVGYLHARGGIASQDGRCRPFDAASSGTVRGNGAGVVVLKRLEDAVAAGDRIHAVLEACAINNDGAEKVGFTAPSVRGQVRAVLAALATAGVPAERIGYVEAHGTGTRLGDSVEIRALDEAHREGGGTSPCSLGSVKANLGHLDAAAGVIGVIKAALVLREQQIPPQINYDTPNPLLHLERTRFRVDTVARFPQRPIEAAAVTSLGLGGTNGHAVLSRHVVAPRVLPPEGEYVLLLSARSAVSLTRRAEDLLRLLDEDEPRLDDLAFSLGVGLRHWEHRYAVAATTVAQAQAQLRAFLAGSTHASAHPVVTAYRAGQPVAPDQLGELGAAQRISLPAYPFDRQRYWVERSTRHAPADQALDAAPDQAVGEPPDESPDQAPADPPAEAVGAAPASHGAEAIERRVIEVLERLLGMAGIAPDDDYFALGGDSLTAVEAVGLLRESYPVELDVDSLADRRTPAEMARYIAEVLAGTAAPDAVVRIQDGVGQPLFVFHPAGGTNFCYFRLAEHLGFPGPIVALTYPHETGRSLSIRDLAELYLAELRRVQPTGPYLLAGYSFGGNLAFEIALRLERSGEGVRGLYLFDAHPPTAYVGERLDEAGFLAALPQMLRAAVPGVQIPADIVLPTTVPEAAALLNRHTPTWLAAGHEELAGFIEIWRHNHEALKGYFPDGRLRSDCIIFDALEEHPQAELDLLRITARAKDDWRQHISGTLSVVPVPGNHYTMFTDPDLVRDVAHAFRARLDADGLLATSDGPPEPDGGDERLVGSGRAR